jgi:hypothetical protein
MFHLVTTLCEGGGTLEMVVVFDDILIPTTIPQRTIWKIVSITTCLMQLKICQNFMYLWGKLNRGIQGHILACGYDQNSRPLNLSNNW